MPNRSFRLFRVAPNYSLSLPTHFYDSFSLSPLAIHTYIHTFDRSTGRGIWVFWLMNLTRMMLLNNNASFSAFASSHSDWHLRLFQEQPY